MRAAPHGKPTFGYGTIDTDVMFVGEAPGYHGCATTGIPFTKDRSGELYQWILGEYGLEKEEVYTTNVVKCWPRKGNEGTKNRTPTDAEVYTCFPHFVNELSVIRPEVVVALGRVPEKILRDRQQWSPILRKAEIVYIPHPAYILRTGGSPGNNRAKAYANRFAPFFKRKSPGQARMNQF
jgi:DNA polymerase